MRAFSVLTLAGTTRRLLALLILTAGPAPAALSWETRWGEAPQAATAVDASHLAAVPANAPGNSAAGCSQTTLHASWIDRIVGNRARLIQICTIGVILGLLILMRK